MNRRQRSLIYIVAKAGGRADRLSIQKLAFLLANECSQADELTYDFVPYLRGPYSFTLAHDLKVLHREGFLTESGSEVRLTSLGKSEAEIDCPDPIADLLLRLHGFTAQQLIDSVYKRYPWYTLNSEWQDRRAAVRPTASVAVYTVGYEGISLDALINLLLKRGMQRLVDVRANPVARRYGFHRSTLESVCRKMDLDYVHVPELGVPSDWRAELDDAKSYAALFKRYREEVLPSRSNELAELAAKIQEKPSALMCMEADPVFCHRTSLAEQLAVVTGLKVQDLRHEGQDGLFSN